MITFAVLKTVAATAAGVALSAVLASPGSATTPDRSWLGVKKILVVSQMTGGMRDSAVTAETLCQRVKAVASVGAPFPVECTSLGNPELHSGRNAVLAVQAAIQDSAPGSGQLLLTIRRTEEQGLEPAPILFGSTLRAVPFNSSINSELLDQAIRASLSELLPWLNQSDNLMKPDRRGE